MAYLRRYSISEFPVEYRAMLQGYGTEAGVRKGWLKRKRARPKPRTYRMGKRSDPKSSWNLRMFEKYSPYRKTVTQDPHLRAKLAKLSHVPCVGPKQDLALQWHARVCQVLGLVSTQSISRVFTVDGVHPSNLYVAEIKTVQTLTGTAKKDNPQLNMSRGSRLKKDWYAEENGCGKVTIGVDLRKHAPVFYAREGFHAYRLATMNRFPNLETLAAGMRKWFSLP